MRGKWETHHKFAVSFSTLKQNDSEREDVCEASDLCTEISLGVDDRLFISKLWSKIAYKNV